MMQESRDDWLRRTRYGKLCFIWQKNKTSDKANFQEDLINLMKGYIFTVSFYDPPPFLFACTGLARKNFNLINKVTHFHYMGMVAFFPFSCY